MPFQPNNKLWKKSHESRAKNKDRLAAFLETVADGGIDQYQEMMTALANGEELPKPVQEFMDRFEGWREFVAPKLARTEMTGKDGGPVDANITIKFD